MIDVNNNKVKVLPDISWLIFDYFLIIFGTNDKQIRISGHNLKNCINNFENSYPLLFRKWGFESTDLRDDVLGWRQRKDFDPVVHLFVLKVVAQTLARD